MKNWKMSFLVFLAISQLITGCSNHGGGTELGNFFSQSIVDDGSDQNDPIYQNAPYSIENVGYGLDGLWFNSLYDGQGFDVKYVSRDDGSRELFVAWYNFDKAGTKQIWMVAQGPLIGYTANMNLYTAVGGAFLDSKPVTRKPLGTLSLTLVDCGSAQASWNLTGNFEGISGSGSISLTRLSSVTTLAGKNLCSDKLPLVSNPNPNPGTAVASLDNVGYGMDGLWFNSLFDGQGFDAKLIVREDNSKELFVAWYNFDKAGTKQIWMVAQGPLNGYTAHMNLYTAVGGAFINPKPVTRISLGTLDFSLIDCENAKASWNLTGNYEGISGSGSVALTRLSPVLKVSGRNLCSEKLFNPAGVSLSFITPHDGALYKSPANITMSVSAESTNGPITKVEYYNHAKKLGESSTPPYTVKWIQRFIGDHMITAKAYDSNGASSSESIYVTVYDKGINP